MNKRVRILLKKEWLELKGRRGLLLTSLLGPLFFLIIPFALVILLPLAMGERAYNDPDLERALELVRQSAPALAHLEQKELFQVLFLRQFIVFSLLVPVMSSMTIATHSIIGEKTARSLEPLLATPITTWELLLGKCLAAAIPAILITWAFFVVYALGVLALGSGAVLEHVINATALCIVLVLAPTLVVLALSLAVITSSRSTDARSAQQIAVVIILPLVGLFIMQLVGLLALTPALVILGSGVVAVIDLFVLRAGISLFERETILTRWK
jgi:ABC-2 type transport system permease protein